jgi:hypothetical protein
VAVAGGPFAQFALCLQIVRTLGYFAEILYVLVVMPTVVEARVLHSGRRDTDLVPDQRGLA